MGATLSVSDPVLSCVLMRDGADPLHVRITLLADGEVVVERDSGGDEPVGMVQADAMLAATLRMLCR